MISIESCQEAKGRSSITLEIRKSASGEPPLLRSASEPEAMFPFYHLLLFFFHDPRKLVLNGTCRHYAGVPSRVTGRSVLIGIDSASTLALFHRVIVQRLSLAFYVSIITNNCDSHIKCDEIQRDLHQLAVFIAYAFTAPNNLMIFCILK